MPVDLQTIEGVDLVSTGTYPLSTGERTFTAEDLAAAVAASADATVPAPRIKIGHDDPRFDEAIASGELSGEPAFGTIENMRLSADGQTLIGDYVNVPGWLAEGMQSSYPGRSIEGGFGFDAPSGRSYEFVISAVALLGVTWPGVTSLPDLQEILLRNGAAGEAETLVAANIGDREIVRAEVRAGLDVDLVRRRFVSDLDEGAYDVPEGAPAGYCWWPRSVRFEDDGTPVIIADDGDGHVYRITFTVSGSEVAFDAAVEVVEQYVPVSAGAAALPRAVVAASWDTRAASRPAPIPTPEDASMTDEQRRNLALALGLPEDTDEATLNATAAERAVAPAEVEPEPEPAPVAPLAAVPDGMVVMDAETAAHLREGAEAGLAVAASMAVDAREGAIRAAIADGRIPPSRADAYRNMWEADAEGARTLLTADVAAGGLAPGLIPVEAREAGRLGDGEGDPSVGEAEHDAFMSRHFPQAQARLRGDHAGVRVRTEV